MTTSANIATFGSQDSWNDLTIQKLNHNFLALFEMSNGETAVLNLDIDTLCNVLWPQLVSKINNGIVSNSNVFKGSIILNGTIAGSKIIDSTITGAKITEATIGYEHVNQSFISTLNANYAKIDFANITNAAIANLVAKQAFVEFLNSEYAQIDFANITNAAIQNLTAKQAFIDYLNAGYMDIDFAHINEAALENLYAKTGFIKEFVFRSGSCTGELHAVMVDGDLIRANTLVADKLILRNSTYSTTVGGVTYNVSFDDSNGTFYYLSNPTDPSSKIIIDDDDVIYSDTGILYQLNNGSVNQTNLNEKQLERLTLNGSTITANSITANKISVDDLHAFEATIGGFVLDSNSIHTAGKGSLLGTGIYLDSSGVADFRSEESYVHFDKDNGLNIQASSIKLTAAGNAVDIGESLSDISNDLINEISDRNKLISLDINSDAVTIRNGGAITDKSPSVNITSDRLSFMQGNSEIAYVSNKKLFIPTAQMTQTIDMGDVDTDDPDNNAPLWEWESRTNQHLSLKWVGN